MIELTINGERHEFPEGTHHLEQIATALGLEPKTLLIEHNGVALNRHDWQDHPIAHGDRLEILRIAAGG